MSNTPNTPNTPLNREQIQLFNADKLGLNIPFRVTMTDTALLVTTFDGYPVYTIKCDSPEVLCTDLGLLLDKIQERGARMALKGLCSNEGAEGAKGAKDKNES